MVFRSDYFVSCLVPFEENLWPLVENLVILVTIKFATNGNVVVRPPPKLLLKFTRLWPSLEGKDKVASRTVMLGKRRVQKSASLIALLAYFSLLPMLSSK